MTSQGMSSREGVGTAKGRWIPDRVPFRHHAWLHRASIASVRKPGATNPTRTWVMKRAIRHSLEVVRRTIEKDTCEERSIALENETNQQPQPQPIFAGALVAAIFFGLNLIFW